MKKIVHFVFYIFTITVLNAQVTSSWRFYRTGNTGIQGDSATSLWIDNNGNPYIAANTGNWGEGGFAKFDQVQNKWVNFSNVDLPVLGGFDNGDIQIFDITNDSQGNLWMAKATGALKFNPSSGSSSLISYDSSNSSLTGFSRDIDIAPDGTIWFANEQMVKYNPFANTWATFGSASILLSVQPKPDGSYRVWSSDYYNGTVFQYNSLTNLVTSSTPSIAGDIAALPGKDCVDDSGNFWALRLAENGAYNTLEYQKPDGSWVYPIHPYGEISFFIDAFKAFGNKQAVVLLTTGESWYFDGTSWHNYGTWRPGDFNTSIDMDTNGNLWVCGIGGAAKRDAISGQWQRYRITNTSQIDYFVEDISIDTSGNILMTGNAGTGIGGIQKFDGSKWTGFNPYNYGLGYDFPFNADNASAIAYRPSSNSVVFSPTSQGIYQWDGNNYSTLENELYYSKGLVEDSLGRLWNLGEYYHYKLFNNNTNQWETYPIVGWGSKILKDPTLEGTVWLTTDYEILRTDGTNSVLINEQTFPESSGGFSGFALEPNGFFWTVAALPNQSSSIALIRYDSNTGQYQSWFHDNNSIFPGDFLYPLTYTPDGLVWVLYDSEFPSTVAGIFAFDGTNIYDFPSSPGGLPNWNMLPNSTIKDVEVKVVSDGYELWMSCLGRGIAVLKVVNNNLSTNNNLLNVTKPEVQVYPNPALDQVTIALNNFNEEKVKISVFDLAGRLITSFTNDSTNSNHVIWDLHSNNGVKVESGIYMINLTSESVNKSVKVVVK